MIDINNHFVLAPDFWMVDNMIHAQTPEAIQAFTLISKVFALSFVQLPQIWWGGGEAGSGVT